ncbi:hypothetical protein Gogos_009129 [Gossypium gossypioides]|uniref:DUF4283 domain-containing protein n=1 Tax=Gossypium gossypioides TaxID=34282 RepID=A0A7J9CDV8_GOSGO|nr:hypothetical protein [Gossypium gossypioides]
MASIADSKAMRNTMANLWHPLGGVHDLPVGLMSKSIGRLFDNFIGQFFMYDAKMILKGLKSFMRIQFKLDACAPLKRRKKTTWPWEKLLPYVDYSWKELVRNGLGSIIKGQTATSINDHELLTLR